MKKILAFITVMAIIFSFAIPSYADYINETATIIEFDTAETAELSKYSMVLDEYFNMRKNQFLRETDMDGLSINPTGLTTDIVERQADREKFISEWKDELRISITDTAINYCIKGEVENNSQDVKLLVYEWVWINYSDHMGLKDVMGFGTDHIISVSSTDGAYFVNSDSYIEITGYTDGNSYDIGALNLYMQENENNFDPEDFRGVDDISVLAASTYNPSDAAAYASQYAGHTNAGSSLEGNHPAGYCPYVYYYSNDCANFVSQCLRAGGLPSTVASGWWSNTHSKGSAQPDTSYSQSTSTWVRVLELKDYLIGLGYTENRLYNSNGAKKGNPIYYDAGSTHHIVMIVEVTSSGNVLICGHTQDAYRFIYNNRLSQQTCYTINMT